MESIVDYVRSNVSPRDYFDRTFPDVRWPSSGSEGRVNCCFHADTKTPSLSLNPDNGKWFCHACDAGGNSIVSFHAKLHNITPTEAARRLFADFVHPVISPEDVDAWHKSLLNTPTAYRYLTNERFLSDAVIREYKLGWNGRRLIVPIENEYGLYVNAKMFDPLHSTRSVPKWVNYRRDGEDREFGEPVMIYPIRVLLNSDNKRIQIEEGEMDTLLQLSMQIPTVTTTAGSKTWPAQYNELFRGKQVVLGGDSDRPGQTYRDRIRTKELSRIAAMIASRDLTPERYGKDCTDWYRNDRSARTPEFWRTLIDRARVEIDNPPEVYEQPEIATVSLDQASRSEWHGKRLKLAAIVTGKDTAPYILPRRVRVTCDRSCDTCPLADSTKPFREVTIRQDDPETLELIDASKTQLRKKIVGKCGMRDATECRTRLDVVDSFNVEQLALIPTIDTSGGQYVVRTGYYVGHGLHANRAYEFEGVTLPSPVDQHATHLFDRAKPMQDEIDTFTINPDLVEKLKVFRPRNLGLMPHLMNVAEWQSRNITKILERPDLHVAVDLAFHSVSSFEFNGELIQRGMLDILIIGDTRCGKGYVTEGLTRYYGLGEVASGENCSFAGLIGGLQQVGKRWFVTWGIIPINHGRLVVIDEASSISEAEFGRMSRVRSEGVAEIGKIVRETTRANTRLIWLSNPRYGKSINQVNSGVQAIKELIGANEDIARFDFALTVAKGEVASDVINAPHDDTNDAPLYPRGICRSLVLWAWSRRPDQIKFTPLATQEVISSAIEFGNSYSPNIPLVQAENIRIKIAKISAALAARVFSSNETGELLIVDQSHIKSACQFLRMIYSKPSMAYDAYSQRAIQRSRVVSMQPVDLLFERIPSGDRGATITGLHDLYRITPDNLADYVGDVQSAKMLIADLVKLNCLERTDTHYFKNPIFKSWLANKHRRPEDEPSVSSPRVQKPKHKESGNGKVD